MAQGHAFRVGVFSPPQIRLIFELNEFETLLNTLNCSIYKAFRVQVLACIPESPKKEFISLNPNSNTSHQTLKTINQPPKTPSR